MKKPKPKARAKRKARNDYPDHRYCVYLTRVGRTEPGIYQRMVSVDGKLAFVHPPEDSRQTADMIPALNVFEEKDDAHRYFAENGGVLKWVVWREHGEDLQVFQAKVRSSLQRRHRGWTNYITSIALTNGKVLTGHYDTVVYDTEKQAYQHLASDLQRYVKDARRDLTKAQNRIASLERVKRKLAQLGITRGRRKRKI